MFNPPPADYPGGLAADSQRSYIRYRTQSGASTATARTFVGTRVAIQSSAKFASFGPMENAAEMAWFIIDAYGGYVDIALGDVLADTQRAYQFSVIAVDEEYPYLKVTLANAGRWTAPTSS